MGLIVLMIKESRWIHMESRHFPGTELCKENINWIYVSKGCYNELYSPDDFVNDIKINSKELLSYFS